MLRIHCVAAMLASAALLHAQSTQERRVHLGIFQRQSGRLCRAAPPSTVAVAPAVAGSPGADRFRLGDTRRLQRYGQRHASTPPAVAVIAVPQDARRRTERHYIRLRRRCPVRAAPAIGLHAVPHQGKYPHRYRHRPGPSHDSHGTHRRAVGQRRQSPQRRRAILRWRHASWVRLP